MRRYVQFTDDRNYYLLYVLCVAYNNNILLCTEIMFCETRVGACIVDLPQQCVRYERVYYDFLPPP